jgi:uncharacterized protein (TIGR03435 family)
MKLLCVTLLALSALGAQTFEAASIKPNRSGSSSSSSHATTGLVRMENVSLKKGILMAYGIPDDRDYALSGPSWLETERFDIVARYPGETKQEDVRQMLQNLYAERFHLALHPETRQLQTYMLVVAKDGPKIKPVEGGQSQTNGRPGKLDATKTTMDKLANLLSRITGQPVVNATGLAGAFTFTLEWTPDETQRGGSSDAPPPVAGLSLLSALPEQLGLKLEGKKAPTQVLVIDHIDRAPTEN